MSLEIQRCGISSDCCTCGFGVDGIGGGGGAFVASTGDCWSQICTIVAWFQFPTLMTTQLMLSNTKQTRDRLHGFFDFDMIPLTQFGVLGFIRAVLFIVSLRLTNQAETKVGNSDPMLVPIEFVSCIVIGSVFNPRQSGEQ